MKKSSTELLVSIIVPVYNVEKYLCRCVDSIINQTYKNIEIILVDDGSLDNCPLICDNYKLLDNRIVVIHKDNGGLSDARNAGLDVAKGKYITFIDSDDWYKLDAIECMVNVAEQNKTDVTCMYNISSNDYGPVDEEFHISKNVELFSYLDFGKMLCNKEISTSVCNKLFKVECFKNHRFAKDRLNEDFLLLGELILKKINFAVVDYTGYFYYIREDSTTHLSQTNVNAVVDAIKNAMYLKDKSIEYCEKLDKDFARIALYQSRTLLMILPKSKLIKGSKELQLISKCIRDCRKYLISANLNIRDKMLLVFAYITPLIAAKLVHIIKEITYGKQI